MSRVVGCVKETPLATMARKTRTLMAMRAIVMVYGLREREGADLWARGSGMAV